jgi:hypothetical protein
MAGILGNWGGNATVANEGAKRVNLFLCMRVQVLVLVRASASFGARPALTEASSQGLGGTD